MVSFRVRVENSGVIRLAIALVACFVCGTLKSEENLLVNPGFEAGTDGPERWAFNHRGTDTQITWEKSTALGGGASVRITNGTDAESGNVVQTIRLDPPLEPGSLVNFSAAAATKDLTGAGPQIVVYLQRPSGNRETATASGTADTHDFQEIRGKARVHHQTDRIVVYLCNYGVGTVFWDNAAVTVERAGARDLPTRPKSKNRMPAMATADGLALVLSGSGGVDAVLLDGRPLIASGAPSGLWLIPFGGNPLPVTGELVAEGGSLTQQFKSDEVGLRVRAEFQSGEGAIRCNGFVEDLSGRDRGLDLLFSLPVGDRNWRWGQSIRQEVPVLDQSQVVDATTFSSLSDPASGEAIALAVPADSPCDCEFTVGGDFGYAVRYHSGLSDAAGGELKSRAPFSFVLYRCDGRWGLRDAARRYYELWPEAFRKRVQREGLWLFGSSAFPLPDPENYAFHEGGPGGWEFDDQHGIYTCPYIIPGQREITRLDKLPESKAEAMAIVESFRKPQDAAASAVPGHSTVPSDSSLAREDRGWGSSMRAIIENCMLFDAHGEPQIRIRNSSWGGNSITFPLNASPWLFADSDSPTVAKALLAHSAELHDEIPSLDGIYVDSLGAWGSYLNHRREHFAFTRVPLSYDPTGGRPVIPNRFTLLEFLWQLGDDMHDRGKLLFANGVHKDRRFHFFALDVMGVEGHGQMEQKRVMAYQKPFLLLIYGIHDDPAKMEYYYNLCTFYGIFPSFANMRVYETPEMYAPVAALNNRFGPTLRAIAAAGWQPVPYARVSDSDVWVERWGPDADGNLFFSLYNSADQRRRANLTVNAAAVGLVAGTVRLEDQLSEARYTAPNGGGTCSVALEIEPERVRVLRVRVE